MPGTQQGNSTGAMAYPKKGSLNRLVYKAPLMLWRLGLGPLLSHPSRGGSKMLVISSWGRKTKKPRHTMVSYIALPGKEYVCSGWGERSDWYQNLQNNPQGTIQVGRRQYAAAAYRVTDLVEYQAVVEEMLRSGGDSHFEPWMDSLGIELSQQDLIDKRDRVYLLGFEKSDQAGPPGMPVDLVWVWGLLIVLIGAVWWLV